MAASLFTRYIWLTDVIYSAGKITREEIDRRWAHSAHNEEHSSRIPERTFHRWRIGVEQTFGLIIRCDKSQGSVYYIENVEEINNSETYQWMLRTFAVTNLVQESQRMQDKILLEDMPSDARFLLPIMEAIRDGHVLSMTYQRFDAKEAHTFEVEPYCMKVFKQRWYMLGRSSVHPDELRVYSLDRVQAIQVLDKTYSIPKRFDAETYFSDYYGVWTGDEKAEKVVIRVTAAAANYLRSLPLHHSQKEMERKEDYSQFEYWIAPSYDFVQELRTHGANLQVLSPQWLADKMRREAEQVLALYK